MSVQTDPLSDGIDALNGSRYDWLLVAIPIPLILGWVVSATLPVAVSVALGAGAVPAGFLVLYGLFVEAPVLGSNSSVDAESGSGTERGGDTDVSRASGVDGVSSFDGSDGDPATGSVPGSADD